MKRSKLKNLFDEYKGFWGSLDRRSEESIKDHSISCARGCDACCKQVVTIGVPEALAMLYGITSSKDQSGYYTTWIGPKVATQRLMCLSNFTTSRTWFLDKKPCLFLKSNGDCWVYEYRPAVCRALLVTNDPSNCAPPIGQELSAIVPKGWMDLSLDLAYKHAEKLSIPVGLSPLPMAMYWANIIYFRGMDEYKKSINGTAFEDNRTSLVYWSQRFGSQEMSVEIDNLLKGKDNESGR